MNKASSMKTASAVILLAVRGLTHTERFRNYPLGYDTYKCTLSLPNVYLSLKNLNKAKALLAVPVFSYLIPQIAYDANQ